MNSPTVSRISSRTVVVPSTARNSSIVLISLPVIPTLYAIPVTPLAQGALYLRVGSNDGDFSAARSFALLGKLASSKGCTHFTWLIIRFAIQSVRTNPSRPMLCFLLRFGRILAKYSLLELMSSVYVSAIPVSFGNDFLRIDVPPGGSM